MDKEKAYEELVLLQDNVENEVLNKKVTCSLVDDLEAAVEILKDLFFDGSGVCDFDEEMVDFAEYFTRQQLLARNICPNDERLRLISINYKKLPDARALAVSRWIAKNGWYWSETNDLMKAIREERKEGDLPSQRIVDCYNNFLKKCKRFARSVAGSTNFVDLDWVVQANADMAVKGLSLDLLEKVGVKFFYNLETITSYILGGMDCVLDNFNWSILKWEENKPDNDKTTWEEICDMVKYLEDAHDEPTYMLSQIIKMRKLARTLLFYLLRKKCSPNRRNDPLFSYAKCNYDVCELRDGRFKLLPDGSKFVKPYLSVF